VGGRVDEDSVYGRGVEERERAGARTARMVAVKGGDGEVVVTRAGGAGAGDGGTGGTNSGLSSRGRRACVAAVALGKALGVQTRRERG